MSKSCIFKFESMSCVDGDGVRAVVFMQGCPLRCFFCHNPEGLDTNFAYDITPEQLVAKIMRYKSYIASGGVTFSGGEPLLHAEFLIKVARLLKNENINIAIETSGALCDDKAIQLVKECDTVIFDLKGTTEGEYSDVTKNMTLYRALNFLNIVQKLEKNIWIRCVIIEGFNDNDVWARRLENLLKNYKFTKLEFLPFHKMAKQKYADLNMPFNCDKYPTTSEHTLDKMYGYINDITKN